MLQYSFSHSGGWLLPNTGSAVCYSHTGGCWLPNRSPAVKVQLQSLWWVLATQWRSCCILQYSYRHSGGCWPPNRGRAVCCSTVTFTLVGVLPITASVI